MAITNASGSRAYITTAPVEADIITDIAASPDMYSVGTIITALDTGIVYQVESHGVAAKVS